MDEKIKQEDCNLELDAPTVISEKGVLLRTSARVSKKLRMTPASTSPGPSFSKIDSNDAAPVFKSSKIKRELWSVEDTNSFFDGLNEFGKDFESIQWFMVNRAKRKGGSCEQAVKSKEQLRYFYYRMWHKISKYIEFPKEMQKVVQELYGLINYGELKRRIGFSNDKNWSKLYEMIYHGSTKVRSKGKLWKVKTPHCRALRKLNFLEDTIGDLKLPGKVSVELRPRDMDTWALVQSLAMNPRIRTALELQKPLSMLLGYLENRWQTENRKLREQIHRVKTQTEVDQESKRILRVAPATGVNITPISVNFYDIENTNVSLLAHRNTHGISKESVESILQKVFSTKKPYAKRVRTETISLASGSSGNQESSSTTCPPTMCSTVIDSPYEGEKGLDILLSSPPKNDPVISSHDQEKEKKEEFIARVKQGWTLANVESIKIGELYLICGSESKIQLEYWFEDCVEATSQNRLSQSLNKLISIAQFNSLTTSKGCTCGSANNKPHSFTRQTESKMDVDQNQHGAYSLVSGCKVMVHPSSVFRRPMQPKPLHSTGSFKAQLDKLQPRYCNRTGRPGNKHVGIVQKLLPLQPKTSLTIVQTSNFRPIVPAIKSEQNVEIVQCDIDKVDQVLLSPKKDWEPSDEDIPDDVSITSSTINRLIMDIPLTSMSELSTSNFSGLLTSCNSSTSVSLTTPSTSPSSFLKDDGNQWMNPDMDFSLSSFLGHLEPTTELTKNDDQKVISNDVEAQFQCLMSENSVDYTAKFADLAARMATSNNNCQ